jgi:hypothetical protein
MLSRVVALLALPMAGLLAQATEVQVRITAANNAAYRVISGPGNTTATGQTPIVARGETVFTYGVADSIPLAIAAADSVSRIHIEARENGRLIATAEGPYVAVLRDSTGRVMVGARGSIPKEPFSWPRPPRLRH